jgi:hypothetical protein
VGSVHGTARVLWTRWSSASAFAEAPRLPSRTLPTAPAGNPFPHPSRKISVLEGGNLRGEKLEGMESHKDPV